MESKYTPETDTSPQDDTDRAQRILEGRCAECGYLWQFHRMSCEHDPRHKMVEQLVAMAKEIDAQKSTEKMAHDQKIADVIKIIKNQTQSHSDTINKNTDTD